MLRQYRLRQRKKCVCQGLDHDWSKRVVNALISGDSITPCSALDEGLESSRLSLTIAFPIPIRFINIRNIQNTIGAAAGTNATVSNK